MAVLRIQGWFLLFWEVQLLDPVDHQHLYILFGLDDLKTKLILHRLAERVYASAIPGKREVESAGDSGLVDHRMPQNLRQILANCGTVSSASLSWPVSMLPPRAALV